MSNLKAVVITALLAWLPAAQAHHSYSMFDGGKEIWMEGTVTEWQWSAPHSFLEVDVQTKDGLAHYWLETAPPTMLKNRGWKRSSLKPGEKIKFAMYPLRNGKMGGALVEVIKADGSKLDGMARGFLK